VSLPRPGGHRNCPGLSHGEITLGYTGDRKRDRRKVSGQTKAAVIDKLRDLLVVDEPAAGEASMVPGVGAGGAADSGVVERDDPPGRRQRAGQRRVPAENRRMVKVHWSSGTVGLGPADSTGKLFTTCCPGGPVVAST
jgi:hypothetical protein